MKRLEWLVIAIMLVQACGAGKNGTTEVLMEGWQLGPTEGISARSISSGASEPCLPYSAVVPGTVLETIMGSKRDSLFLDATYQLRTQDYDQPWIYARKLDADLLKGEHLTLEFMGLGYYAGIWYNGVQIDTTEGVFLSHRYDVTAHTGKKNVIAVELRKARPGDLNIGFVDWNPAPADESMGIVRPIYAHISGPVRMDDIYVQPIFTGDTYSAADLEIRATLSNLEPVEHVAATTFNLEGRRLIVRDTLAAGVTKEIKARMHIDNPRLWWCRGMGKPELYSIEAGIKVDGKLSDSRRQTFGIREVKSRIDANGNRLFSLNGKDLLVRGAGWTDDIFLGDTHESIETQVRYVADMNLNCIRFENIWGKDDHIYDMCDRYGLLALVGWSCQWEWKARCGAAVEDEYGCIHGEKAENLAAAYFQDQVTRLRNHPSIFVWLTGSDKIPVPELEERYVKTFRELTNIPYCCSAASHNSIVSGPSGMKMNGPYDYVGPEYWYVDTLFGGNYGFNTETGIGVQIPEIESLRKFLSKPWPIDENWNFHCTTAEGEHMSDLNILTRVMDAQYGKADSLEDYLNKANAISYDATRAMFEAFRCNFPTSTGIIQWMLNSAWPSLYWQVYDSYLVPTASYYAIRKACEPIQMVFNYKDESICMVNESGGEASGSAIMRIYDASCTLKEEFWEPFTSKDREPVRIFGDTWAGNDRFLELTLEDGDGRPLSRNVYAVPAKGNVYDWEATDWAYTPIREYADMGFVTSLPKASVKMEIAERGKQEMKVVLKNVSDAIAYRNVLKLKDSNGDIITPAFWSDNYFSLMPGQELTISCRLDSDLTSAVLELSGWNAEPCTL